MAQTSRPCKGCGATIYRTIPVAPIKHYCGPDCRPRCSVDGCDLAVQGLGLCSRHYKIAARHNGDPTVPVAWRHGEGGYDAVHHKLRLHRGPARDYPCVDCGGVGEEWSYDHEDPDEVMNENLRYCLFAKRPFAYSRNIDHYESRCVSCHRSFDIRFAAAQVGGA